MTLLINRNSREQRTIKIMIRMYCKAHHAADDGLCPACDDLLNYAMKCIGRCPFKSDKPTCLKCPVHCYKPEMRESVRKVMQYAGPGMIIRHPVLTVLHYLDGRTGFGASRTDKK